MSCILIERASETLRHAEKARRTVSAASIRPRGSIRHARARKMSPVNGAEDLYGCSVRQPDRQRLARPRLSPRSEGYIMRLMDSKFSISWQLPGVRFLVYESWMHIHRRWSRGRADEMNAKVDALKFSRANPYFCCVRGWRVAAVSGLSSKNSSAQIRKDVSWTNSVRKGALPSATTDGL